MSGRKLGKVAVSFQVLEHLLDARGRFKIVSLYTPQGKDTEPADCMMIIEAPGLNPVPVGKPMPRVDLQYETNPVTGAARLKRLTEKK